MIGKDAPFTVIGIPVHNVIYTVIQLCKYYNKSLICVCI